jgi:hypothetical protein
MQHENSGSACSRFLTQPPVTKPGTFTTVQDYGFSYLIAQAIELPPEGRLLCVPSATINGITFKVSDIVILNLCEDPVFAQTHDIVIVDEIVVCVGHKLKAMCYDSYYNGYIVEDSDELKVIKPACLKIPWPINAWIIQECGLLLSPMSLPDVDEIV